MRGCSVVGKRSREQGEIGRESLSERELDGEERERGASKEGDASREKRTER